MAKDLEDGLTVAALRSIRTLELPIGMETLLARQTLNYPDILGPLKAFVQAVASFRGTGLEAISTPQNFQQLNIRYLMFRDALGKAGLDNVAEQIRGSLIEAYDASLKGLLGRTVEEGDLNSYRHYLRVMQWWVEFLGLSPLPGRDIAVLQYFPIWLRQWANESMPDSFVIQDRNWRYEFDAIEASKGIHQRYENPHVLHNLLHQYSLAGLRLDTSQLPRRVQALERFCSTFSSRSTKVLRFEKALLEIQIPMGTHKASYVFTPRQIAVEWTEPPDCPEDEIARILAFEVFLDRFRSWMFPSLKIRREQVLGTWTLFIRLHAHGPEVCDYENWRHFVVATRFLFDASYDFSYVANEAVEGFAGRFGGSSWKAVLDALVQHRAVLDDTSQYVALHALPMSSTVAAIAQSQVVRGLLLRCLHRGFAYCRNLIDDYARWLQEAPGEDALWSRRYELLRQACLFLAANWPREALAALASRDAFNVGDDLIAACLFKRSDLSETPRQYTSSSSLTGMSGMIMRHAPEIGVAGADISLLGERLTGTKGRFRRARHLLVARFADRLNEDTLAALLSDLDIVPWGQSAHAEQAIQRLLKMRGPVCRFELEKGIDWTSLDTWSTLAQRPPTFLQQ